MTDLGELLKVGAIPMVSTLPGEAERLANLAAYRILDTPDEAEFDALTKLATQLCGMPTALITFLDEHRQWFKSRVNMAQTETPRHHAFCAYTIRSNETFEVEDATADDRFLANPLVTDSPGIRAYCGVPLITPDGHRLGSLCVIDYKPGLLTVQQKQDLRTLAEVVIAHLELRRRQFQLEAEQARAAQANAELALSNEELKATLEEYDAVNEQLQRANGDIQVLMQQQLFLSEKKFEELIESITELFFSLDGQLQCVYWNRACELFTGIPASSTVGRSIYQVFPQLANGRTEATMKGVLASKEPVKYEYHYRDKDQFFKVRMFPSRIGLSVLVIDITENKRKEQELLRLNQQLTDRNFELDQIVYKISHDIRSPLTSVLGLLNVLQLEPLAKEVQDYLGLIENRILKLNRFTQSMLDFSRTNRTQVQGEAIDFAKLVEQCTQELAYLSGYQRLKISLNQQGPTVYSDLFRMRIIFQNLLANAIKYQHPERDNPYLSIAILSGIQGVLITFEDNGLGIALEHQPRIFEMFYRATQQSDGSGLGTYIVKQTIENLGGQISLTSKPGQGTTFELRLPNWDPQQLVKPAGELEEPVPVATYDSV